MLTVFVDVAAKTEDTPFNGENVRTEENRKNAATENGQPNEIGERLEKNVSNMLGRVAKHEARSGRS